MDRALEIGQTSATGSFHLLIGKVASTLILAVGTIILQIYILQSDYGLYAVALIPSTTFLLFQDWGVGNALIRFCALGKTTKSESLRKVIVAGLAFEVATGIALTVLSLLTANFIASTVFGKPGSAFLIALASVTILSTAILVGIQSVFIGFEQMKFNSYLMIISSIIQGVSAPLLVFLGYGAVGAIVGFTLASVVTGISSALLLYFSVYRKLPPSNANKSSVAETLKPLLRYGVPLAIGGIVSGLLSQFYALMMAKFVSSTTLIGNFKVASNFAILLTFFTFPVSTVLFPAFSKLDPQKDHKLIKTVFASSVKYTTLLLIPATMAMIVLSGPIVGTIYGNKWLDAPLFLILIIAGNLLAAFGNLSVPNLLSAVGETKLLMEINLVVLFVGIPLGYLLIPPIGIIGYRLSSLFTASLFTFIGLYYAWKRYGTNVNFKSSIKILAASFIASGVVFLFLEIFTAPNWVKLASGLLIFLAVYLAAAPLVGATSQTDINILRAMFSKLGIGSKILEIPLKLMETFLKKTTSQAEENK